MAGEVLIYGDTVRSPELRHEVPIGIGDPFLYAEAGGARHVVIGSLEIPRVRELDGLTVHPLEEYGLDELIGSGKSRDEIIQLIQVRAVQALGIAGATVPDGFPLALADELRAAGTELWPDRELFSRRRRVKNAHELAGVRRAQHAAHEGMRAAAGLLRRGEASGDAVLVDGEPLTSERIKTAISEAFIANGCSADEFIVSHGPQSAIGHHMGAGAIRPNEPIVIDIWPRDNESSCFADMTRSFVVGAPPAELVEWHRLTLEALRITIDAIRPGAGGRAIYDLACDVYEAAGQRTQRTKTPGEPLEEGFFHGLGHGVGLEVHEGPTMGLLGQDTLVPGDVVTIEPGLYRPGFGGVRLEDLILVTEDGYENLTDFSYDLAP